MKLRRFNESVKTLPTDIQQILNNAEDDGVSYIHRTNWREVPQVVIEPEEITPEEFKTICLETVNRILNQGYEVILVGYFLILPNGIDGITPENIYNAESFNEFINDKDRVQENWLDILHKLLDVEEEEYKLDNLRIVFML